MSVAVPGPNPPIKRSVNDHLLEREADGQLSRKSSPLRTGTGKGGMLIAVDDDPNTGGLDTLVVYASGNTSRERRRRRSAELVVVYSVWRTGKHTAQLDELPMSVQQHRVSEGGQKFAVVDAPLLLSLTP